MNSLTPPKHKTPNYKLVSHRSNDGGQSVVTASWEPVPLRQDRKDLKDKDRDDRHAY